MEPRIIDNSGPMQDATPTKGKPGKLIPGLIIVIVTITLASNLFLLYHKAGIPRYFFAVNLITGISLVTMVLLSLYSRKKLKGLQSNYIHRIFHKN